MKTGSKSEPELFDGLVNVRSVRGLLPLREKAPPCQDRYRILPYNHGNLVREPNVINSYILPVLQDGSWSACGAGANVRAFAPSAVPSAPQLVESNKLLLTQGVSQTITVPVDSAGEASFSVVNKSVCDVSLQKPDGTLITSATTDASIAYATQSYEDGMNSYSYTVTNPAVGNWVVSVSPTTVPTDNSAVLAVSVTNGLSLSGSVENAEYATGATPRLTATLTENDNPRTGATMVATGSTSTGATFTITLLDDGAHNDGAANDGVYGAELDPITIGGVYNVTFKATGNNAANEAFQRVAFGFFSSAPATASLTRTYSDSGVDDDSDGTLDALQVLVGVNVAQAGDFLVEAELRDAQNQLIVSALGRGEALAAGNQTVALRFAGSEILRHGQNGPYRVTNIKLYADTDERPVWIETDTGPRATGTYTVAQFDHPPSVVVLQPDDSSPVAVNNFNIILQASDEDNAATVSVYYDTDNIGNNGVLISSALAANGERTINWNTSAIPNGSYFIYAIASDGIRAPVTSYSLGAAQVQHPPTISSFTPASGTAGTVVTITGLLIFPARRRFLSTAL